MYLGKLVLPRDLMTIAKQVNTIFLSYPVSILLLLKEPCSERELFWNILSELVQLKLNMEASDTIMSDIIAEPPLPIGILSGEGGLYPT
ncbi:hypothetical protein ACPUYX_14380 [Desulfosporosinus sp. SYSU MS00001]|uniref:hypothetical protein n=1 Tax=Desulfosporosinus sp. SYSU MS00001 TaxID=3416284 RepID=UPI003CF318AC